MTRDDAIDQLTKADWLAEACRNIAGPDLWKDLRQEFFVQVIEKTADKFEPIGDHPNDIRFWAVRILSNIGVPKTNGKSSKFYESKFVKNHKPQCDIDAHLLEYHDHDQLDQNEYFGRHGVSRSKMNKITRTADYRSHAIVDHHGADDHFDIHTFNDFVIKILGSLPFYERQLFNLCANRMSFRELERLTGIPRGEISARVDVVKNLIKREWNKFQSA